MNPLKIFTLMLGITLAAAVFMPFVRIEQWTITLWDVRSISSLPFIVLLGTTAITMLALRAMSCRLTWRLTIAISIACLIIASGCALQFNTGLSMVRSGGLGAFVLIFGGAFGSVTMAMAIVLSEPASR